VASALVQARFRALAPALRTLLNELDQRQAQEEYGQLLADCHSVFIDVRAQLLSAIVNSFFDQQQAATPDLVGFVRGAPWHRTQDTAVAHGSWLAMCTGLRNATDPRGGRVRRARVPGRARDFPGLFRAFAACPPVRVLALGAKKARAASHQPVLPVWRARHRALMEAVVTPLHDRLRPRIIRELSVETLVEMCEIFLAHMTKNLGAASTARNVPHAPLLLMIP